MEVIQILQLVCEKGTREEVYHAEGLLKIAKWIPSNCRSLHWIKVTQLLLYFHCFVRLYQQGVGFLLAREIPKSRCAPVRTKEQQQLLCGLIKPFSGHG